MASKMNPGFLAMMAKKKGDPAKKMAGGMHKMPDGKMMKDSAMKHGGGVKKMMDGGMAYAKGGSVSSRADGIAKQGKTKGTMVTMKNGGKC